MKSDTCPLLHISGKRRFLVLISVRSWVDPKAMVRLDGLDQLKNPMTSRIKSMTLWLVA
jgi:hypothetical protein